MTMSIIQSSARAPLNISSSSKAQFGCMSDSVKILRKYDQKWLLQASMKKAGAPRHI